MTQGFIGFLLRLFGTWGCGEGAGCMAGAGPGFRYVFLSASQSEKSKYLTQ